MGAIPDLAMYLQEKHGFSYLLTGKLTSDPIEGRQVNGGNYFMCVKQLIQAEKKIRVLNLLQQNVLKFSSKLLTSNKISLPPTSSKEINFKKFDWLVTVFSELSLDELSCIDANNLFVSGHDVVNVHFAKKYLLKATTQHQFMIFLPEECTYLFDIADRGGLSKQS